MNRREAGRFAPPPWEENQFEELSRRRDEEEAAARTAAEQEMLQRAAQEPDAELDEAVMRLGQAPAEAADAASDAECESASSAQTASSAGPGGGIDEARMTAMLAGLAAEEPPAARAFWKTSVIVGAGMVVFGAVFLIWGMAAVVAARKTGAVGMFGGSVLLLFGAGFVVGGLYVVAKNLRQRGVL